MGAIFTNIAEIFAKSGWAQIFFTEGGWKYAVMLAVACVLLYLAIVKQFEPLLLLPIGFGMLMTNLPLDGIFVAIGRAPETTLFAGMVETDEDGYLLADESTRTSLPGVFAAGDVRKKPVRQIVTAVADGAVAAMAAERYLAER